MYKATCWDRTNSTSGVVPRGVRYYTNMTDAGAMLGSPQIPVAQGFLSSEFNMCINGSGHRTGSVGIAPTTSEGMILGALLIEANHPKTIQTLTTLQDNSTYPKN